jgi:hypothetical protein
MAIFAGKCGVEESNGHFEEYWIEKALKRAKKKGNGRIMRKMGRKQRPR